MPDLPCSLCVTRCSMFIHSQYSLEWVSAWLAGNPVPECLHYKEHHLQGVRA